MRAAVAWGLVLLGGCRTAASHGVQHAAAVSPINAISDAELFLEVKARLGDKEAQSSTLARLRSRCAAGFAPACGRALLLSPPGPTRDAEVARLSLDPPSSGTVSALLRLIEDDSLRRDLADLAMERWPRCDDLLAQSRTVLSEEAALRRFALRPGWPTLFAVVRSFTKTSNFETLELVMELAVLTGDNELLSSQEFWLLRGHSADRSGKNKLAIASYALSFALAPAELEPTQVAAMRAMIASFQGDEAIAPLILVMIRGAQVTEASALGSVARAALHRTKELTKSYGARLMAGALGPKALREGALGMILSARFESDVERRRQIVGQAVTQNPDSPRAWRIFSSLEDDRGDHKSAIGALRIALKLAPDHAMTLNNLAYILALHAPDRLAEAEALSRRSLALSLTASGLDTLAEVRFRRGDQASALRLIDAAAALEPSSPFFKVARERIAAGDPSAPIPATE